tara:strand:+ start:318 stop:473 length:156 start_codon:yes stop_codon:yes gene_type:complete
MNILKMSRDIVLLSEFIEWAYTNGSQDLIVNQDIEDFIEIKKEEGAYNFDS